MSLTNNQNYKLKHLTGIIIGIAAGMLTFWLAFKLRNTYYVDTLIVESITTICMTMSIQICVSAVYEVTNLIYNNKTVFLTKGSPTTTLLTLAVFNKYTRSSFKVEDERSMMADLQPNKKSVNIETKEVESIDSVPIQRHSMSIMAIIALGLFVIIEVCSIGLSASMPRILGTRPLNTEVSRVYSPEAASAEDMVGRADLKNFLRYEFSYNETDYDKGKPLPIMTTYRTTDHSYLFGGIFSSGFSNSGPDGKQLQSVEMYIGNVFKQKIATSGVYNTDHTLDGIPYVDTKIRKLYYGNDYLDAVYNQSVATHINIKLADALNKTSFEVRVDGNDTYTIQVHHASTDKISIFGGEPHNQDFVSKTDHIDKLKDILNGTRYDNISTSNLIDIDSSVDIKNVSLAGNYDLLIEQLRLGCNVARTHGQAASILYDDSTNTNILINYYVNYITLDNGDRIKWCETDITRRKSELYVIDSSSWPKRTSFSMRNILLAAAPGGYRKALEKLRENRYFRMKYSNFIIVEQKTMYNVWPKCTVILSFMSAWIVIKIYAMVVTRCYSYADLVDITRELALSNRCTENTFNVAEYKSMYVGTYYNRLEDCNHLGIKFEREQYKPAQPGKQWRGRFQETYY